MIIVSKLNDDEALVVSERNRGNIVFVEKDDNAVLARLMTECQRLCSTEAHKTEKREECFLVMSEPTSLWMLQTIGVPDVIREHMDVFATTVEDLLAKTLLVKLPSSKNVFPTLDRTPITYDSNQTVHLVFLGWSALMEAISVNAALVAHYPNYCRDTRLRTRITIVDKNVLENSNLFIQRYQYLFDNSYYRTINLIEPLPQCVLHHPEYEGRRKDFVDIEWEFIAGDINDAAVRRKLTEWSSMQSQQLTIVLCHDEEQYNINTSLRLPEEVYDNAIPVLCSADKTDILQFAAIDKRYSNIYPFGRSLCDIDLLRMLKKLAKRVNYVYNHCFALDADAVISAPANIDILQMEKQWNDLNVLPKVYSNVFNAMALGTKMHSVGHATDTWDAYYALSIEEINLLMEVEHNRWNVEELLLGYRPVTDEQQRLIEEDMAKPKNEQRNLKRQLRNEKYHYDLRAFDDLRQDATGKNVNVYDWVLVQGIPLIIKSCITD